MIGRGRDLGPEISIANPIVNPIVNRDSPNPAINNAAIANRMAQSSIAPRQ
jgi:hypothetical protein